MPASQNPILHCPIRGTLKVKAKAKDGLTFTEEKLRIDCIKHLLAAGYPADRIRTETKVLRLGHKGKNSLRADIVVYNRPAKDVAQVAEEKQRAHILLVAEIKREAKDNVSAKENQLKPALALLPKNNSLGIYWDDVEQTLFYKEVTGTDTFVREASITQLPPYGGKLKFKAIHYKSLRNVTDLVKVFSRFDDVLHQAGHDLEERYTILLQILLVKIYDEHLNRATDGKMILQDFSVMDLPDADVVRIFNEALTNSLVLYQNYLPKKIPVKIASKADFLREIAKLFCRVNLLQSSPQVMQEFYMYFARHLYKVDLAQYFTPYEVVEFIVKLANPRFGDSIKDPACGSADFLVAAYRLARERHKADIADQVYGSDMGNSAVQISVLNMILNGDGKSNIKKEDSLATVSKYEDQFTVMLCNPPFGKDIREQRKPVLSEFDLGHCESTDDTTGEIKTEDLSAQETGILFVEVCVKSAKPGQRVAIILPNGYLGNRSERYIALRRWILRHTRVAVVVGFPRFTFKKSGADVSASVVIMEKREEVLAKPEDTADYPCHFNLLEKVGWDVRNKRAAKLYQQSEVDGTLVLDQDNEPRLDADFDRVLKDLYHSPVVDAFPWIATGVPDSGTSDGWSVQMSEVLAEGDFILDPKRWCPKYRNLVTDVEAVDHFSLGEVLELAPTTFKPKVSDMYRYVEIAEIFESLGAYEPQTLRGWNLPGRAKLLAKVGDIFIAHIWSSVGKWFIAGADAAEGNLIVTSGCYQLRIRSEKQEFLPDLVFGLSTELFRIQMRALATGSDGLSVISELDLKRIVLPRVSDATIRADLQKRVELWTKTGEVLPEAVSKALKKTHPKLLRPMRPSHVAQV